MLQLLDFKGEIPRRHPRLLPKGFAQRAVNTRLEDGCIGPVKDPLFISATPATTRSMYLDGTSWLTWTTDVDAVPGPVATDRLYITGDGAPKMRVGEQTYNLALPGPVNAPTATALQAADPEEFEEVFYVYTWVTEWDEESPPSPPTDIVQYSDGVVVRIDSLDTPPAGRMVDRVRFYRSQTSAMGNTSLYYVHEMPVANTSFDHDLSLAEMAEPLPSNDYDTPPASMKGLISLPNGIMAAFDGKELLFSEPYRPHAWPEKYRLFSDYQIVALAAFGPYIAVLTTGTPYLVQGTHPDSMSMQKIEEQLPCLSKAGAIDVGYAVVYPSTEGLVVLQSGGPQVISKSLFTRSEWTALRPETFIAGAYSGRYVFSCDGVLPGGAEKTGVIDLSGEMPFLIRSDIDAVAMFTDFRSGKLYWADSGGAGILAWDEADQTSYATAIWRTALLDLPAPSNFAAILIEADDVGTPPSFTARIYADGILRHTITTYNAPQRLPSGFLADRWEIEVEGNVSVSSIALGGSFEDLQRF
jgi:hypothetical protein